MIAHPKALLVPKATRVECLRSRGAAQIGYIGYICCLFNDVLAVQCSTRLEDTENGDDELGPDRDGRDSAVVRGRKFTLP